MPPAARIGDMHTCPMVTGVVPHVGGPVVVGCPTVIIGMMPAARVGDMCVCVGPPDVIARGSMTVIIGGQPAARIGDLTVHGGIIVMGCPTVMIGDVGMGGAGGAAAAAGAAGQPEAEKDPIDEAIEKIKNSEFGKTEEGKKVLKKIEDLRKDDKIEFKSYGDDGTRGEWGDGKISVSDQSKDPDFVASELVHEATHALNEDENPAAKAKNTIDEEMRTNNNQLDLYQQQRESGFRDAELERRNGLRDAGTLRDDVRTRYPGVDEHL